MMKLKLVFSLAGIIAILFFACRKDFRNGLQQENPDPFLTLAKNYFYSEQSKSVKTEAFSDESAKTPAKLHPLWARSVIAKLPGYELAELPVLSTKRGVDVYNFNQKPLQKEEQLTIVNASFQRLLIYRTQEGIFRQRLVTYIPNLAYLKKHSYDASDNYISRLQRDFSGYIEYSELDGTRLFVLCIVNGKTEKAYRITPKNATQGLKQTKPGISTLDGECNEVCDQWYTRICFYYGDPVQEDCGDWGYDHDECSMVCDYTPTSDPTPVSSPPQPPLPPPDPDTIPKKFCGNSETNSNLQATINNNLQDYSTLNCATKFIYKTLAEHNFNMTFCVNGQQSGNAGYNAVLNTLTFANELAAGNTTVMAHEMFHAYQDDFYGNTNQYAGNNTPGYVNIEFEDFVMADIVNGSDTAFGPHGTSAQQTGYENWLISITNNFTEHPNLTPGTAEYNAFMAGYFNQLNIFSTLQYSPYNGAVINTLEPKALLNVLKSITNNCQ